MSSNRLKNMRIRYRQKRNGPKHMLESTQHFRSLTTNAQYKIRLDTENMTFQVINVGQRKIVKSGGKEGITNAWLKITAKRALESLGVSFNMELRQNDLVLKQIQERALKRKSERQSDQSNGNVDNQSNSPIIGE